MYRVEFDNVILWNPIQSFEKAKRMIKESKKIKTGKVLDLKGNVLFTLNGRDIK